MNREWYRQGQSLLEEIRSTSVSENEIAFWYLGQCGFAFKTDIVVYIDPMLNDLRDRNGNPHRHYDSPFSPSAVEADYVICTHNHADHLAPETLSAIASHDSHTRFVVPSGLTAVLEGLGIARERIVPVSAGVPVPLDGLTVTGISAAHPDHQVDADGNDLALSYQLQLGGTTILHLGDTYLTEQLLNDLQKLPSPDLFFPPINGGDFFRTCRACIGNLNFNEAAELARILDADLTIPTHFDMVTGNTVNPLWFIQTFMDVNPSKKWHIPALGERFFYHR